MKRTHFTSALALVADQRNSRKNLDMVPLALELLRGIGGLTLPFERTAGDEIQALTDSPAAAVACAVTLTRATAWRFGIGVGTVETPLPSSTREARGGAYLAARAAITRAHTRAAGVAVVGPPRAAHAEAALALVVSLARRRTAAGWEVADLLDTGVTRAEAAEKLAISRSAISQRATAAHVDEVDAGRRLCADLLAEALNELSGVQASLAP